MIICKSCVDPAYCQSILGCCEIAQEADIERLEDLRQSGAYYEQLKEDKEND